MAIAIGLKINVKNSIMPIHNRPLSTGVNGIEVVYNGVNGIQLFRDNSRLATENIRPQILKIKKIPNVVIKKCIPFWKNFAIQRGRLLKKSLPK